MKVKKQTIINIFIILYCILPAYFQIAGVRASNILALVFVLTWVLFARVIQIPHIDQSFGLVIILWGICRVFTLAYHSEYSKIVVFLSGSLLLGWILVPWINTKERFTKIIDVIINVFAVLSLLGIIESALGFNIFAFLNNSGVELNYNAERLGFTRIISFTGQTINYCLCCAIVAILVIYRITTETRKIRLGNLKIIYGLLLVNIALTFSRSIIICFIASQIIILYKLGFKKFIKRILQISVVALIVGYIWTTVTRSDDNIFMQFVYMLLAVFNENYADKLASNWGVEDTSGIGHRISLYLWVWEKVKNDFIIGLGERAEFEYLIDSTDGIYTWTTTKTSIEVNWLSILYHYGVIGLVTESLMYITILVKSIKTSLTQHTKWEGKLNFNFMMFVIILMNLVAWFAVNQTSEASLLYIIIILFLAYNTNRLYEEEQ